MGIIPAYAGSTMDSHMVVIWYRGSSPHTRGAPADEAQKRLTEGDHPRIRGEHDLGDLALDGNEGIIPAYAGSTRSPLP